jgi:hypothetical protein
VGAIEIILLVLTTTIGVLLLYGFLNWQASFTKPSIDEVEDFVKAVHRPKAEELFDPVRNQERRSNPDRYRREHRVVVEILRDYLLIMLSNATFLGRWANTEDFDMRKHQCQYSDETIQRITDLMRAADLFRKLARRALFIMWIWRLSRFDEWKFFPLPDVASLRKIGGIDILEAYGRLRRAAQALSEEYGDEGREIARYINSSMLGPGEISV